MSQSDRDAGALRGELPSADSVMGGGPKSVRIWFWGLAAAILAGLIGWGGGEVITPFFTSAERPRDPEQSGQYSASYAQFLATSRDVSLVWGLTGALLGLGLGLAGAIAFRRPRSAAVASAVGALAGAILGGLPSLIAFPRYWDYKVANSTNDEIILSLAIHAVSWCPVGLAGGMAFGLGSGGAAHAAKAALGGLIGAMLGVFIYELLGAFVLPYDAVASQAVPEASYARLIGTLVSTVGASVGVILILMSRPSPNSAPLPAASP